MKQVFKRLISLMLVMAMTLSMTVSAFAVEKNTQEESTPQPAIIETELDIPEAEVLPGTSAVAESKVEEADEADEVESTQVTLETRSVSAPVAEAKPKVEEAPIVRTDDNGWNCYTLNEEKAYFTYYYTDSKTGKKTQAKNGYYKLDRAERVMIPLGLLTGTYEFASGIYYFDDKGYLSVLETKLDGVGNFCRKTLTTVTTKDNVTTVTASKNTLLMRGRSACYAQMDEQAGLFRVKPQLSLYSGKYNERYYYQGKLYEGFYRSNESANVWVIENGVTKETFSGKLPDNAVVKDKDWKAVVGVQGLYYTSGKPRNGLYRAATDSLVYSIKNGVSSGKYTGIAKKGTSIMDKDGKSVSCSADTYYMNGTLYSGYYQSKSTDDDLYVVKNGKRQGLYTGAMTKNSVASDYICNFKKKEVTGRYYEEGKLLTGVASQKQTSGAGASLSYYKDGKKQKVTGWKKINGKVYYFNSENKALTGEHTLVTYGAKNGESKSVKYTYIFKDNGQMVTNLFKYNRAYRSKKLMMVFSRSTHTGTILVYNSKTQKYDIPAKSFVTAMSVDPADTRDGTYQLRFKQRWWEYINPDVKNPKPVYYKYAMHVWGSGSLLHSCTYSKPDANSLKTSLYNKLGKNVTYHCVRMQMVNCKLIWDLGKIHGVEGGYMKNMNVKIHLKSNVMPFGKMTIYDNFDYVGKIASSFDPTDPECKGKTVKMKK